MILGKSSTDTNIGLGTQRIGEYFTYFYFTFLEILMPLSPGPRSGRPQIKRGGANALVNWIGRESLAAETETETLLASNAPNIEINMVQGQVLEDRVPGVRGNGIGRAPRRETLYSLRAHGRKVQNHIITAI